MFGKTNLKNIFFFEKKSLLFEIAEIVIARWQYFNFLQQFFLEQHLLLYIYIFHQNQLFFLDFLEIAERKFIISLFFI